MKVKFAPVVIFLSFWSVANAQSPISFTSANMPAIGFSEVFAVDTPVTSVNYGNAGANQVYDFSALSSTHTLSISYATPTSGQLSYFPTANQALSSNGSFVMLDLQASKYTAVGLAGTAYGLQVNTPLSPTEILYEFPTQYQSTYADAWGFYQGFTGDQANESSVDSVREVYTDHFSVVVDGWGKVITPVGSYRGLRIKRIDTMNVAIGAWYSIIGSDSWHNEGTSNHIITSYSYVSLETKGTLVSFSYNDTTNAMRDAQYSLIPPAAPIAGFGFVTGAAGLVTFTDTSEGYPTRYHWNFGDNDTSNVANPTHTYAANGTYYVCETVYNPSGSNTVCDSVHITDIVTHVRPVAVNDSATVHQPNNDTINVTANDHSPSNDPFCVTNVYGGQYFTVFGCNDVAFDPNANFTGYDTCHYIECNTNQPTLCDTAELIVHVIATAVHSAPVAVNDTAIDIENTTDVINVLANDHSPTGDPFCVTHVYGSPYFTATNCNDVTFSPATNFTGYDTAWYIECNTGQPTLCDTARVIVEVVLTPVSPVAVNDVLTVLQPSSNLIDVTANDYSPSNDPFCITSIYGSTDFSIVSCSNLTFHPDSTFTGNDTAWYVICNTGQPTLCDTASVIVTVEPNPALLPIANIGVAFSHCAEVIVVNNSLKADSIFWNFHSNDVLPADTIIFMQDSVQYGHANGTSSIHLTVCLTATNKFGTSSQCDTIETTCVGINEVQLSGIRMYPNPASSQLSIDMSGNTNWITGNYTTIEIYNAMGQKIKTINCSSNTGIVNVDVAELAPGVYLATITDAKGTRSTLGKFTVMQ